MPSRLRRYQHISTLDQTTRTRFVDEYLIDLDAERAAATLGLDPRDGVRLAASPSFQRQLDAAQSRRSHYTQIYGENVLRRLWQAYAFDARRMIELRRVCCRFCHGLDHRYQFTPEELRQATQTHLQQQMRLPEPRVPFDDQGGLGYDRWADPHPDCPECAGQGEHAVYLHDTRDYTPSEALMYLGVKVNKDNSVQLLLRDLNQIESKLMDHLGLGKQPDRHAHFHLDPATMSDEQLDQALAAFGRMPKTIEGSVEE